MISRDVCLQHVSEHQNTHIHTGPFGQGGHDFEDMMMTLAYLIEWLAKEPSFIPFTATFEIGGIGAEYCP